MSFQLVPVNVCGQQLQATWQRNEAPPSLAALKETVEQGIGMQQDWIQFYDNNGTKLLTDEEVSQAISDGRAPIHATISDHSVHNFEQRREEFAHMQWKVMRDQFTVLSLQVGHTQQLMKNMQQDMLAKEQENIKEMTTMKNQLGGGLQLMDECKTSTTHMEAMVTKMDENLHNMGLKLNEEAIKRDTAMQDVQFKMDRLNTAQQHETARLAEAFDSCLNLLQQADGQLGQDLRALEQKLESSRDLMAANQEDALKAVAQAQSIASHALADASSALIKQAHDDAEKQVNELAETIAKFETRIIKGESLASDTANRWLSSHEQLKANYNSVTQAVEQCRLQIRTDAAKVQEVRDKILVQAEAVNTQTAAIKTDQQRERKDRQEQCKSMQANLDGMLKTGLAELEQKMSQRVDREADERISSIRQALDDIGTVLEKEIPSSIRREEREKQLKKYRTEHQGSVSVQQATPSRTVGYYVDTSGNTIMTPATSVPVGTTLGTGMRTSNSVHTFGQRQVLISGGTGGSVTPAGNSIPAFPVTIQ